MKKVWKIGIGIGVIAEVIGAIMLIRAHNAEVCDVWRKRYDKGYELGYIYGTYDGKRDGATAVYRNRHKDTEEYFNNYMKKTDEELASAAIKALNI